MDQLLETCPITPLGVSPARDACFYRLANGDVIRLPTDRHSKNTFFAMFGAQSTWLEEHFPQWSKPVRELVDGNWVTTRPEAIVGFDTHKATQWLITECATKGTTSIDEIWVSNRPRIIPAAAAGLADGADQGGH